MAKAKQKSGKDTAPMTTSQMLGGTLKSARDIMRKDKGLNGDLDRLPLLTWIMFLKFLDDLEQQRQEEAKLAGEKFKPAIEKPYRWRDWAADPQGITGDELLAFINNDEAVRADGKKGSGLFAYLRRLSSSNGDNRRDVIATVFKGVDNRMKSGYLLRDVVNKLGGIHFTSSNELQTLGALYESMLREMRDAAGDSGEFYTPRAVVRFMVEVTDPRLGETVLDPASGTGGFLVEAFSRLEKQVKTVGDRRRLQTKTITGCEPKSLPYLLCQMNLLLHGLDAPKIDPGNALRFKLSEIGEKERVDVILTNPPFGGEEEKGIQGNFPTDRQTAETALLFMQLIMRKLRRAPTSANKPARAAVIVPNGTLYASGVAERVRQELITNFNLHTIVRLPKGVFEPYADIPTNILFFDTGPHSKNIWFYQHPLPPHRAHLKSPAYSQSDPIVFEEFEPLIGWWKSRQRNEHAWVEDFDVLANSGWNLDRKNPSSSELKICSPLQVADDLDEVRGYAIETLNSLKGAVKEIAQKAHLGKSQMVLVGKIGDFCDVFKGQSPTMKTPAGPYKFVVTAADPRTADHYSFDAEAVCIPMVSSTGHGHASIHRLHYVDGKFALANIMAALTVKPDVPLIAKYLYYYLTALKEEKLVSLMSGTANTSLTLEKLAGVAVAFPGTDVQLAIVSLLDDVIRPAAKLAEVQDTLDAMRRDTITSAIGTLVRQE